MSSDNIASFDQRRTSSIESRSVITNLWLSVQYRQKVFENVEVHINEVLSVGSA